MAGCGGSGNPASKLPPAQRVCSQAAKAARSVLGAGVSVRITDRDPTNIECLLLRSGVRTEIVSQATAQAWVVYGTATVHLEQAFGAGSVHEPGHLPRTLQIPGALASWVPDQQEVIATNGTLSTGGSFLTVTVTREPKDWNLGMKLTAAVAKAVLPVAPRGPSPAASSG
jgi:hypothetical protein